MVTPDYLTTNQSKKCPRADYALLLEHYKTPTQFWGQLPTVAPFAWQSNKATLLYFTPNSVSELLPSTSEQSLSFGNNSVNSNGADAQKTQPQSLVNSRLSTNKPQPQCRWQVILFPHLKESTKRLVTCLWSHNQQRTEIGLESRLILLHCVEGCLFSTHTHTHTDIRITNRKCFTCYLVIPLSPSPVCQILKNPWHMTTNTGLVLPGISEMNYYSCHSFFIYKAGLTKPPSY